MIFLLSVVFVSFLAINVYMSRKKIESLEAKISNYKSMVDLEFQLLAVHSGKDRHDIETVLKSNDLFDIILCYNHQKRHVNVTYLVTLIYNKTKTLGSLNPEILEDALSNGLKGDWLTSNDH